MNFIDALVQKNGGSTTRSLVAVIVVIITLLIKSCDLRIILYNRNTQLKPMFAISTRSVYHSANVLFAYCYHAIFNSVSYFISSTCFHLLLNYFYLYQIFHIAITYIIFIEVFIHTSLIHPTAIHIFIAAIFLHFQQVRNSFKFKVFSIFNIGYVRTYIVYDVEGN